MTSNINWYFIYCQWYYHIATGRCPGTSHLPSTYTSASHTSSPDRGSATRHAGVRCTTLYNTSNNYVFILYDTCKYIFLYFTRAIFIVMSSHLLAHIVVARMSKQFFTLLRPTQQMKSTVKMSDLPLCRLLRMLCGLCSVHLYMETRGY